MPISFKTTSVSCECYVMKYTQTAEEMGMKHTERERESVLARERERTCLRERETDRQRQTDRGEREREIERIYSI